MKNGPTSSQLSRRERQILEALHRQGPSTVAEVLEGIPEPPGYSAVRALLKTLETKGHIHHRVDGPRYVYEPVADKENARLSALSHVVETFFDGSTRSAVAALLGADQSLEPERVARLLAEIDRAREEGR